MATPVPQRMDEKQRNRLIAYVKKYPILYRPLDATKSTETRDLRQKLWNDIGSNYQVLFSWTRFICQFRWTVCNLKWFALGKERIGDRPSITIFFYETITTKKTKFEWKFHYFQNENIHLCFIGIEVKLTVNMTLTVRTVCHCTCSQLFNRT